MYIFALITVRTYHAQWRRGCRASVTLSLGQVMLDVACNETQALGLFLSFIIPTDTAGLDFQSGVIQPYFNVQTQRALFYVPIVKDKMKENAECFYMTLRSPKNGDSYNPEIRAWSPSRAVGWIQSTRKSMLHGEHVHAVADLSLTSK